MKRLSLGQIEVDLIRDKLEQLLAIETLEYHNKNYLSGDNKTHSESKRSLMLECLSILGTTAYDRIG